MFERYFIRQKIKCEVSEKKSNEIVIDYGLHYENVNIVKQNPEENF